MIRKILKTTDTRLREISKPVKKADKKLLDLVKDLEDTVRAQKDPPGVGLAAPQIGILLRVFVIVNTRDELMTFINPEILEKSKETNDPPEGKDEGYMMEGCLSLPHYYGPVQRAKAITVRYQTIKDVGGKYELQEVTKKHTGFLSQAIQHETDHLDGIFFVDHLLKQNRKLYRLRGEKWQEIELV